jgi:hypothetical protein
MNERSFSSSLIGQRLIEAGYLTEAQLREALAAQADTGLLLGEICMLKGWLDYGQLKECLPKLRSKLGERLLALGYITMEQLWLAIFEQRQSGDRLGAILVERGWIDKAALDTVTSYR